MHLVIHIAKEISKDSGIKEEVIYHEVGNKDIVFARDIEEFFSEVDKHKENSTGQKYRFEKMEDD